MSRGGRLASRLIGRPPAAPPPPRAAGRRRRASPPRPVRTASQTLGSPQLRIVGQPPDATFFFFTTFQSSPAAVPSVFPARSLARTAKVCSPGYILRTVCGDVQGEKPRLPSSLHSNVEPGSLDLNSKVALCF